MLTEEERREIEEETRKCRYRQAAGPEALGIVQKHRGWISPESLGDVARFLDMTDDELDSVATCYNLLFQKPAGRHRILVCDSVSCWIMGGEQIRDLLSRRLGIDWGQTTADGRFTLLPTSCLGACDKGPAMMVDDDLHVDLQPEKLDGILAGYE
jgi:NADH-quinone oxidoreductase subunit E